MTHLAEPASGNNFAARSIFTLTVFTSAFLLFAIQPMFTKMVLPQLGGSPAVWSVAMVFFQALLLLGYLYAHLSTRYLSTRVAVIVHVCLLLVTFLALPIAISPDLGKPPAEGEMLWLIGLFFVSVGLPFFAVAGNGPILQAWFSRTGHKDAANPYFLYAASNLGSFAALLLYPVAIEPILRLQTQAFSWSAGFAILTLLILASGAVLLLNKKSNVSQKNSSAALPAKLIANYIWLSFLPSALLVAVTAHITTDVASAPSMWIIPLALFLLTFFLIFRESALVPMKWVRIGIPASAGLIFFTMLYDYNIFLTLGSHLLFFFLSALMFHHRLYILRPAAEQLTQFYLWMSFGGVIGGIFAGLLAPYLFNSILEYPILVSAVMLGHPAISSMNRTHFIKFVVPTALVGLAFIGFSAFFQSATWMASGIVLASFITIASFLVTGAFRHPLVQATLIPITFALLALRFGSVIGTHNDRSFFGVNRVYLTNAGQHRILAHGTTVHGAIRIKNEDGTEFTGPIKPLTYYHPDGILAQTLKLLPPQENGREVAVVGLGSGAHGCNGQKADRFTFFEIDASVVKIASNPSLFSFLSKCTPDAKIVLGDARLTLQDQPTAAFDYILLDAFSSDAIPVHLLTREALAIYMSRLKKGGYLVLHISNRNMELQSVTAALARDANLAIKARVLSAWSSNFEDPIASSAVVIAEHAETLAPFTEALEWKVPPATSTTVWTDDYSNVLGAIWRNYYAPL